MSGKRRELAKQTAAMETAAEKQAGIEVRLEGIEKSLNALVAAFAKLEKAFAKPPAKKGDA